jgi:DNA-binding protein HU-beta
MAGKVMTKAQLVSLIAEKAGITKATANGVLELLSGTAVAETKKNGQFIIPGIGKTVKSQRKARMGRNPQTGETIKIKAITAAQLRDTMVFRRAGCCNAARGPPAPCPCRSRPSPGP